jgi:hypothetical protein
MKKILFFLAVILPVLFPQVTLPQSITNTLGTSGLFSIKDGTATYLSLYQSNGYLSLNRSLIIPYTTSSTTGVIYKGTESFIHDHRAPGTQGLNTFVGLNSGNFTMIGVGSQASYNTAMGYYSLGFLTSGSNNTAIGVYSLSNNSSGISNTGIGTFALNSNTTGIGNTGVGDNSLYSNTDGSSNTAVGIFSMQSNTTGYSNTSVGGYSMVLNTLGYENTALGIRSLNSNTTGFTNTAIGIYSLSSNTTGNSNTGLGSYSLYRNVSGIRNTAVGYQSLYNSLGFNNTALGYNAGNLITSGSNNTAIGNDAQVPSVTSSNQVRIGNTFVTYAGVQVAWTITSDRRWKKNILASNLGLGFISKLKPVSYTRINDKSEKTEYGFIAQDVEEVLKEYDIEKSGVISIDDEGRYEMRYNDLLAPMVKAIQELKEENDMLRTEIESLKKTEERLAELEGIIHNLNRYKKVNSAEE